MTKSPIGYILIKMRISFYQTHSGNSPIEKFIESLPRSDQARFAEVYDGIIKHGLDCPRVIFKPIKGKLWEVKFKAEGGGYRILYVIIDQDNMVWLHAFKKKTQRTPQSDLRIAEKRMKELL